MNANKNRWLPCAQFEVAYFYLRSDRFAHGLGTSHLNMPSSKQRYKCVAVNYQVNLKECMNVVCCF